MPDSTVNSVRQTIIEGSGQLSASLLGILNKVCGQIFALLLLSPKPLSLDDIVNELQVSKGSVSINIRLLEEYKLVKKIWVKGSRRDYYEAVIKVPTTIIREFLEKIRRNIQESLSLLDTCQEKIKTVSAKDDEEKADMAHIQTQLQVVASFFSGARFLFDQLYAGQTVNTQVLADILKNDY